MSRVATLLATVAGLAVAAAASLVAGAGWALVGGLAAVAAVSLAVGERVDPLVAAICTTAGLGALTYLPVVPPAYPDAIGTGLLVAGLLVLLGVELGVRAGEIVAARGVQHTGYGRSWEAPTAVLAIGLLAWRLGPGGRTLLGGVAALLVGAHAAVVRLGGSPRQQAVTLVPVALVAVAVLAAVSADEYVAEGTEHSPLERAGIVGGEFDLEDLGSDDESGASDGAEPDETSAGTGEPTDAGDPTRAPTDDPAGASADDPASGSEPDPSGTAPAASPPETPGHRESVPTPEDPPAADGTAQPSGAAAADAPGAGRAEAADVPADARTEAADAPADGRTEGDAAPGDDGWSWPDEDEVVSVVDGSDGAETAQTAGASAGQTADAGSTAGAARATSDATGAPADAAGATADGAGATAGGASASTGASAGQDVALRSDDAARDACQNCGAETADCEPRVVVADPEVRVALCPDCHAARIDAIRSLESCLGRTLPVDVAAASSCQGCGASGDLEAHPVVPLDAAGHRHPNNVLALCPDCHARVEAHRAAE